MDDYRIGQEYETSVTVQQVLETISDTILQIVLFQVEAKENVSYLVNLNVKPLIESMKILVELAKKKTEKWTGKEEEKNKVNMLRACDTMTQAMNTIEKSLEILGKDIYHKKAKDELLWASRTVVQCTVTLLQIADNYDIRKIIYGCKSSEEEQKKLMELEDMGGLPEIIRRYIYEVVNLAKTVESRCNYIPDPILSKKYREANKVIAELPEPLIQMYVGGKTQNNEQFLQTAKEHDKKLKEAYKELIKLSKLSSQEMFAGIDLDLNPLDDDDPNRKLNASTVTMNDLGKKLQGYLEENNPKKVLQTVGEIQDKGNDQLRLGKDAENRETDPNKKDLLHAAAGNLANALKNLMENAKIYAEKPTEENKKKVFQAIDSVVNSSDNMKRTQDMPDHFDKASENVALMLANLGDLVKFGTEKEAVEGVKKVISEIQEQVKQAQNVKFERGPNQKKAMQNAIEEMKPILQDLLSSTKGVLANKTGQNAPKFLQSFEVALENANTYSKKIEDLTHPERRVDTVETPNDKLLGVARRVENAIDELWNAGVEKIVPKFKELNTVVAEEIIMAKEMGYPKEAQKLQKALDGLTNPIRNYAKDPKNPTNLKELDVALSNIKNAQQELLGVALTPKELAMHSGVGLKKHGADLIDAVRSGDTKRIPGLLEDVQRDLNSQAQALRLMPVEGELAKEFQTLAGEQEQLAKKLPAEVEKSVKTKNLTPLNLILEKAGENSKKIIGCITPDIEGDLISHTAKLNNAMNMLKASKEVGDDQTAQSVLDEIMDLLKGDDILCSMLGGKTFNKKLKQTLLDCGQEIADILSKLAETGGNIANLDLNQIGDMLIRVKKLNDLILGTTGDPVEKIAQIGEQIENLIDNLEFPVNTATQTVLSSIVDGLEQQILLADLVGKEHEDRKDHLDQAVDKAKRHLEVLKPAVVSVFNDLEDKNAQKRLQNILFDTKDVSADIVDASQPPMWERVISNCNSLARDLPLLSENVKKGNKTVALNLLENIANKMNAQAHLVMSGAKKISNEKLKKDLQEAGTEQEIIGGGFFELGKNRIEGTDWSFTAKFNSTYNKSTKLNETILSLAKKALSGGEEELEEIEETDQQNTANELGVISLKVRKVAQELQVDDSPKGQMFGCTKEIGKLLDVLSNAAKSGDKAEMIRTTKEIANNVQKVLTLTKSINCNQDDKDKIISFALNAKNFGTQLKILTAVKASINETDKTAENQLVTCAQQLAENVMNCVKMTDIASLKK